MGFKNYLKKNVGGEGGSGGVIFHQDSRGPLAQDGSVEDRGSFHKSSCMYFMPT